MSAEHRMRVSRIMRDTRLDARGKRLSIWHYVLEHELMSGTQFVLAQPGGQMYAVIGATHEVLRVPSRGGAPWFGYLNQTYGLLEREPWTTAIHDAFRHYIQRSGIKAEMRRFAAYSKESHTTYVSNYDGRMYKIDADHVSRVPNGEDGIFFADDDGGVACVDPDIGPHGLLLDRLTSPNFAATGLSGITPDLQRKALTMWIFALAFPDLLDDKPILLVEGVKGSGKCLGRGTPVLMLDGSIKPVEQIVDGDLVMGPDLQPRQVSGTTQGFGSLYRVVPAIGDPWICNDVHMLTVIADRMRDAPANTFESHDGYTTLDGQRAYLFRPWIDQNRRLSGYPGITESFNFTLEAIDDGEFFGFELDGDGRFLLGDFTVTHNTTCVTHAQLVLTGAKHPMVLQRNKEDDFGVILSRSPIALFDNTDSFIDWVPDAIAAYATGAAWHKRKLFTDDENLVMKPQSFIAVATRNPASFRRDDVADRCMILRFDRRPAGDFVSSGVLMDDLLNNRPALFGEYLYYLGQITTRLRAEGGLSRHGERSRMASFASFGRIVGAVLGWAADEVTNVLEALQNERDAFVNEEDPLVELLGFWIVYKPNGGVSNIGRQVNANQLHAELETFAQAKHIQWNDTPRTIVNKLRSTQVEHAFRVEVQNTGNQRLFKLWRHSDPRLELVGGYEGPVAVPDFDQ